MSFFKKNSNINKGLNAEENIPIFHENTSAKKMFFSFKSKISSEKNVDSANLVNLSTNINSNKEIEPEDIFNPINSLVSNDINLSAEGDLDEIVETRLNDFNENSYNMNYSEANTTYHNIKSKTVLLYMLFIFNDYINFN